MGVKVDRAGFEVREFADTLKVLDMLVGRLVNFEQSDLTLVIDDGTTLNISLGLVRQPHQEFGLAVYEMLENLPVDVGAQVIELETKM